MAGRSRFSGFVPGRMYLWVPTELTSGDITGGANNSRMFNIPRGYLIRSILLKTGVKATTVSGGNNAYSTLSNTILTNVKVFQGANKLIRWWPTIFGLQEEAGVKYGGSTDTGYGLIDFAMNGDYTESLNTVASVAGATGDVDTFVQADIAGASNQGALALYEELRYAPSLVRRNRSSVSMAGARR